MFRVSLLVFALLNSPAFAQSDQSGREAAIKQMVDICITKTDHPQHDSDLCKAFIYGTHYQASIQRWQRFVPTSVPSQTVQSLSKTQPDLGITPEAAVPMVIVPNPGAGAANIGQVVR